MPNKIIFVLLVLLFMAAGSAVAEEIIVETETGTETELETETGTKTETEVVITNEVKPTDDQKTIIAELKDIFEDIVQTIKDTADKIDSVNFDDSFFSQYLGYARYVLGDTFYLLFSSICLISLGIGLFTTFLRGWQLIRSLLP